MTETIDEILRNEHFRWVVDAVPNGMLIVKSDGVIVLVNEEVERLFDYDRTEMLGMSVERLVPERRRRAHHRQRAQYDGATRRMGIGREQFGRKKDGSEFPLEIGLSQIATSQGPMVMLPSWTSPKGCAL